MKDHRQAEVLYEIGAMRHLPRVWRQFGGPNVANVAEHSWRTVWIAWMIAIEEKADVGRTLQLAMVHDLGKSRAGDAHWLNREFTQRDQLAAGAATVADTVFADAVPELQAEFVAAQTLEAKIVRDADNLDCDLEFIEQFANWEFARAEIDVRKAVYEQQLHTETARRLWREIQATPASGWYVSQYERMRTARDVGAARDQSSSLD